MKKILNKQNYRICIVALIAILSALIFVFLMDFDLLKAIYEMYYGDSEISEFFKEQGTNVFNPNTRATTFLFTIYRAVYSCIPIIFGIFLEIFYHTISLPERLINSEVFKNNPSLSKILQISRYLWGTILFFLCITINRTFINSTFHNCIIGNVSDYLRISLAVIIFLIPTLEWKRLFNDLKSFPQRHGKLTNIGYILLISFLSFCLVELQIGSKLKVLIYLIHTNIMYWIIIQLFFLALFRNPKPGAIVSLVFSYVIGLANDVVYQFRGNYIMFGDLTVVRTALEVAGNYDYRPTKWFWISIFILLASIAFTIFIKLPKDAFAFKRIVSTVIVEIAIVLFVIITFRTGDFYGKVFGVGWDYNENVSVVGYIPYFLSNMDSTRKVVVEDYSVEKVQTIFDEFEKELYENDSNSSLDNNIVDSSTKAEPNIILIQNEAFSDPSITFDIETDIDPMPFIHSMSKNTEKGYLNMSVTGGPTSNTEFEVLSRSSLQFFPFGSVPYTQYLKQHIPSLVECLKNQKIPYHTVAYHSYYSSGYNRNSVYDYMGFDEKLFENNFMTDFSSSDIKRGYLTDEANYRRVISEYEECASEGKPFFCFNVTIQGHGGYTGGPYEWDEPVSVTNFQATDSLNTYLSSVRLSDKAFGELIEYFSQVNEPTIIFMYGDHQPGWDDDAKELLEKHPAWDDERMQSLSQYYVPYIIWANYDIEEKDNLLKWNEKASEADGILVNSLSTNYVGSYLMSKAGVELSLYDKYLLKTHEEIPALTAIGVWDSEGGYYENAISSLYSDKLSDLEKIQYNLIFDDKQKLTDRFLPE